MTTLILKKCSKCGDEKPLDNFGKHGKYIRSCCKKCNNQESKNFIINNPKKAKEQSLNRRKNNKEKLLEMTRNWRKNNPEKSKSSSKKWRKNNIGNEKAKEGSRNWKKSNPEKRTKHGIIMRIKNKFGIDPTIELIEVKRLQITLHRLIKEKSAQQSQSV